MSKINFYDFVKTKKVHNPGFANHGISIPYRMIIASPSGSGKTNALLGLIYHFDKTFQEIIVCVKSADEPLYELLENKVKNVRVYENGDVPDLSEFSKFDEKTKKYKRIDNLQRLIVFDDLITSKNANIKAAEYYIKARKLGFSMCYISQEFYAIPKIIRTNSTLFLLGRNLLNRDLKMILSTFPSRLSLDEFAQLYNDLLDEPLDTLIINIEKRNVRKNITGEIINV